MFYFGLKRLYLAFSRVLSCASAHWGTLPQLLLSLSMSWASRLCELNCPRLTERNLRLVLRYQSPVPCWALQGQKATCFPRAAPSSCTDLHPSALGEALTGLLEPAYFVQRTHKAAQPGVHLVFKPCSLVVHGPVPKRLRATVMGWLHRGEKKVMSLASDIPKDTHSKVNAGCGTGEDTVCGTCRGIIWEACGKWPCAGLSWM